MLAVLGPLLSLLGFEAGELKQRVTRQALVWLAVGGLGLIGICFLLVAIHAALTTVVGPVIAPLLIAVTAIIIAVGVYLAARLVDTAEARRMAEKKRSSELTSLITTAAITAIPLILRSPLIKDIGIPAGAALASALWFKKDGKRH